MPPKSGPAAAGKAAVVAPAKGKKKSTISDADARNLYKTFSDYDADGSGEISLVELQHFFSRSSPELYVFTSPTAIKRLLCFCYFVVIFMSTSERVQPQILFQLWTKTVMERLLFSSF
jgi:hypothetical protein